MICENCYKEIDFLDTAEYLWDRRCVCKKCAAEYRAQGVEKCGAFRRAESHNCEEDFIFPIEKQEMLFPKLPRISLYEAEEGRPSRPLVDIFTYHAAFIAELYRLIDHYDGMSVNEIDLTDRLEADGISKGLRKALGVATDLYVKGGLCREN